MDATQFIKEHGIKKAREVIDGAKQLLEFSKDCKTIELSGSVMTIERLEQAIADYEAIYSENNMVDD